MAIASLVLGIVGIVLGLSGEGFYGMLVGVGAIILGALARRDHPEDNKATIGLVLGIVAVALDLLFWVACAGCVACGACALLGSGA